MITARDILSETADLLRLPKSTRTEARRRTIICRSYYAAYHHLRGHPIGQGFVKKPEERTGMHRAFLNYLERSTDRRIIRAQKMLNNLYDWRIRADYRLNIAIPNDIEQRCFEDAESLVDDLLPT
ncbi:MAG: hypothetical protein GC191_07145 [Azospirillum sp.]|nr:hypothetical protein [Azospirillum sp.]